MIPNLDIKLAYLYPYILTDPGRSVMVHVRSNKVRWIRLHAARFRLDQAAVRVELANYIGFADVLWHREYMSQHGCKYLNIARDDHDAS
jgi:hypothetical protein